LTTSERGVGCGLNRAWARERVLQNAGRLCEVDDEEMCIVMRLTKFASLDGKLTRIVDFEQAFTFSVKIASIA